MAPPPEVLETEKRFELQVGSGKLSGRVDRIDRTGPDTVDIVDYKTGKPRPQDDADKSLQLSLYAIAAREVWDQNAEHLIFTTWKTDIISTTRSDGELEEAKHRVQKVADGIAGRKFPANPGHHCTFCPYRNLCPETEKIVVFQRRRVRFGSIEIPRSSEGSTLSCPPERSRRIIILARSVDAIAQGGTGLSMDVGVVRLRNCFAARSGCSRSGGQVACGRGAAREKVRTKNFGDALRVPVVALLQVLSAFCCFSSLLSFWLPWIYSPFPFFMESCNGRLLQLIECIESTQNEVKRKMIEASACNDVPKSPRVTHARQKSQCDHVCSLAKGSRAMWLSRA